jgi:hypothetical protein
MLRIFIRIRVQFSDVLVSLDVRSIVISEIDHVWSITVIFTFPELAFSNGHQIIILFPIELLPMFEPSPPLY